MQVTMIRKADSETLGKAAQQVTEQARCRQILVGTCLNPSTLNPFGGLGFWDLGLGFRV